MKCSIKWLAPVLMVVVSPAQAKPKRNPLAPYRPNLREFILEDVQVERFRLEDPEEKKWLDLTSATLDGKIVQKDDPQPPVAIGSLHK